MASVRGVDLLGLPRVSQSVSELVCGSCPWCGLYSSHSQRFGRLLLAEVPARPAIGGSRFCKVDQLNVHTKAFFAGILEQDERALRQVV